MKEEYLKEIEEQQEKILKIYKWIKEDRAKISSNDSSWDRDILLKE